MKKPFGVRMIVTVKFNVCQDTFGVAAGYYCLIVKTQVTVYS